MSDIETKQVIIDEEYFKHIDWELYYSANSERLDHLYYSPQNIIKENLNNE